MDKIRKKANLILVCLCTNEEKSIVNLLRNAIQIKEIDYIVVVNNLSIDGSKERILSFNDKRIILIETDKDGGYGYGMNFGFKHIRSNFDTKFILTCNADILINEASIKDCLKFLEHNTDVIAVSSLMKEMNGNIDLNWGYDISKKDVFDTATFFASQKNYTKIRNRAFRDLETSGAPFLNVPWIRGSFEMFRADVLLKTDLYDENIFMYGEENVLKQRLLGIQNGRFAVLKTSYYFHNHINNSNNWKIRRKYIKSSRLYYLRHYLNANFFEVLWYKFLFWIGNIEYRVIYARQKRKN